MYKKFLMVIMIIVLMLSTACTPMLEPLSNEKSADIACKYFNEKYGLQVTFVALDKKQIAEHEYLNFITVKSSDTKYELTLNKNNEPLCDNKKIQDKIKLFDKNSYINELSTLNLHFDKYYPLNCNYYNKKFKFDVIVDTQVIPSFEDIDKLYKILCKLRDNGVDSLSVLLITPEFLMPKIDLGHGGNGLQIAGPSFDTKLLKQEFEKEYKMLVNSVHINKTKLLRITEELNKKGFKNTYFYIKQFRDGATIELVLYCESNDENAMNIIKNELNPFDDSYFKIKGKNTGLTIELNKNGISTNTIYK